MDLMIDLCSGLKGASAAMRERGWKVISVDNDPECEPDIVADILHWSWEGERPDLIWASPPCDEFAREFMPWSRTGSPPDLSIIEACKRIIEEAQPRFWVIENVKGAIPYLGQARLIIGPFHLWGFFPDIPKFKLRYRKKESMSSSASAERARIPYQLSYKVAIAVESAKTIFEYS